MPPAQLPPGARRRVDYGNHPVNVNLGKAYQAPIFKPIEKEEVRNMYRNLKI